MSWTRNEQAEAAKQQLAQEAMALIEQAEQLETQEEFAKAAFTYQQAAEKLQRSGYAPQYIEDIYQRVTTCNNRVKLAKKAIQIHDKQQIESLQQQAFSLMDIATTLKKEKRYSDAIEQYLSAANLLTEAGWKPEQLEGIRGEITHVQQLMATAAQVARLGVTNPATTPGLVPPTPYTGAPSSERIDAIKKLEEKRKHDDEVQQSAFWAIDEAKKHTANNDYEAAIQAYQYSITQLKSIGWTDQVTLLLQAVQELEQLLSKSGKSVQRGKPGAQPYVPTFQVLGGAEPPLAQVPTSGSISLKAPISLVQSPIGTGLVATAPSSAQIQAVTQFETKRKKEKELIEQAFVVIEEADKCVQSEDWDGAISKCNQAINLFNQAGWNAQTSHIYTILAKVREGKAKSAAPPISAPQPMVKDTTAPLPGLEASNVALQSQLEARFAARRESVQEFEARKKRDRDTQEKAFTIIQEAQEMADKQKFGEASQKYISAIDLLNQIGWQQQTQQLQEVLNSLQERQRQQETHQQAVIQQQITAQRDLAVMQEQAQTEITAEQERMRLRQASQQEVEAYRQKVTDIRTKAISLIEEAERSRSSRPPNFPNAIQKYEEAKQLLASIQWQDQVTRLQDVLGTIHQQYDAWNAQQAALAQKQQQETAMRAALDREIRKRMEEDARLKESQQKSLLEYQAKRSNQLVAQDQAMNLLDDAKKLRQQFKFTDAIEKYKQAIVAFQDMGWVTQVGYIHKEIQATLEHHERWQDDQKARQQSEKLEVQKVKEMEEKAKQEALAVEKMRLDLKSMIKKASIKQEQKEVHEQVQQAEDYQKYLTKEQADEDKRKKMASLKEQVRRELAEKEAKMREEQERAEQEKAKAEQKALKDMIRKATKKPDS